jgi:hypothetical protein
LFIGTLCINEYEYLRLDCASSSYPPRSTDLNHPGWTAIYASSIYLLILILLWAYRNYGRVYPKYDWEKSSTSSDEDEPLVKYENKKFR